MARKQNRSERDTETYEGPSAEGRRKQSRVAADPAGTGYDKHTDGPNRPSV